MFYITIHHSEYEAHILLYGGGGREVEGEIDNVGEYYQYRALAFVIY